jgi:hypothetical protein
MAIRLKPVIYTSRTHVSGSQNTTQQMLLLKAMEVTQDPKKWREMIGVRTVADVYRTLDKMGMRKEYHEALAKNGISFDFIVGGIGEIAANSEKDDTRLKALQTLLKSMGMDKYDAEASAGEGSWEEILIKKVAAEKELPTIGAPMTVPKYEVTQPVIPESARKAMADEAEISSTIYETDK